MHIRVVQIVECCLESIVQIAYVEVIVADLIKFEAINPIL
jgi:hypothetical protein